MQLNLVNLQLCRIKCSRRIQTKSSAVATETSQNKQYYKGQLRSAVEGTKRGACTSRDASSEIEEALINVEQFNEPLDDKMLAGKWKLIYTTAPDVVGVLLPGALLPLEIVKIEEIYQEFSDSSEGKLDNIIQFSIPGILREGDGGTLRVNAGYVIKSRNTIQLSFFKGSLGDLNPTDTLQNLILPAMLPRGYFNQQLFLALKEFKVERSLQISPSGAPQPIGNYLLTYLDEDMFVGRAVNGKFVFDRVTC
eukprot:TRINITY_DN31271_c0_g1_i2.p1 TRINITY_DN31271_c0_g1~~TRINITY_DN31271_c0_g1_i2.p1  ORF type:complete len:251 (-),score=33.00 TRINITY_DN31271_c0_g1_i2:112-864(-)